MNSYQTVGRELAAPSHALYEWNLSEKAPFGYRVLFRSIIESLWLTSDKSNRSFYWCYIFVSLFTVIGAAISFYYLLLVLSFSNMHSLVGVLIFLLLPPIFFAYTRPVHTREDMLAYLLLNIGLIVLIRKNYIQFLFVSIIGVLCRETLMILPFTYLFFTKELILFKRALIASFPITVCIFLRLFIELDTTDYNPILGLEWNLSNPVEVLCFAFIVFGPFWIFWLLGRKEVLSISKYPDNYGIEIIAKSSIWVVLLICLTTVLGGIFNEIRIMYLAFPWIITLSLCFIRENDIKLYGYVRRKRNIRLFIGLLLVTIVLFFSIQDSILLIASTHHDVSPQLWLTVGFIMLYLTLLALPVSYIVRYNKSTNHSHIS